MKSLLLAAVLCLVAVSAQTAKYKAPYIGEWSNGRGEVLIITESTVKFEDQKTLRYQDITKASDGSSFTLLISSPKGFFSKYVGITIKGEDEDEMRTEVFANIEDQGTNNLHEHNWFKDN